MRQHRLRLQEALHKAFDRLNRAAAERAHFTDRRETKHALQVGDHVYLCNRVLGRNKIQDFWRPELHQVTSPFRPSTRVHDEACGRWSRAHSPPLRPFAGDHSSVVDSDHQPERPLSPSSDACDSESDSDDELHFVSSHQNPVPAVVRPPPIRNVVPVTPPVPLPRRSWRFAEKNCRQCTS